MLEIHNLHVNVAGNEILRGIDLVIRPGETHAIMGPNGSGKSTLANVIAGKPGYDVTGGDIIYEGKSIINTSPDLRALSGIFLAFQYPVSLPGVRNRQFLKSAIDAARNHRGDKDLTAREFDSLYKKNVKAVGIDSELMKRSVNEGFSGGETKRSEMLQLSILDPKLAILDETDSGLDIDALKSVATVMNQRRRPDNATLLVTHYQRILTHINPDFIHVLIGGNILMNGGPELASQLESRGYQWIESGDHSSPKNT